MSAAFERDGFCIPSFTLDGSECDAIVERVVDQANVGSRSLLTEPWCGRLAERIRVGLGESLPEVLRMAPVQCTCFRKDVTKNWLVGWHQDRSLPFDAGIDNRDSVVIREKDGVEYFQPSIRVLESVVAVRVHLDACRAENGPLRLLAGTHLEGILGATQVHAMQGRHEEIVPEIARGGMLVLRPLVLHASSKSTSSDPRRVLHFVYR